MRGYEDLAVWQRGILLVKEIYALTSTFPSDERFGLISQMRRAAVSVPSNIAEGQARHTTQEFIRFVGNAEGSLAEVDTQLLISCELGFCSIEPCEKLRAEIHELRKMLNALRRELGKRLAHGQPNGE